jgi:hypothetical protein
LPPSKSARYTEIIGNAGMFVVITDEYIFTTDKYMLDFSVKLSNITSMNICPYIYRC